MMNFRQLYIVIFGFAIPVLGWAQPTDSSITQLGLLDAIQVGLNQNFQILVSKKSIEKAINNNTYGQAGGLPTVDLGLNQNNSVSQNNNPASFLQGTYSSNSFRPFVDVNFTIFSGFKIKMTKEKLDLLQSQSEGNATLVIQNTIQAIILAYYDVVVQQKKLEIFEEVKNLSRDQYELNQHKKDLGTITTFDLVQVQSAYFSDSTSFINQELAVNNAVRNLNLLLALPIETEMMLVDTILPEIQLFSLEALHDEMFSNNQNLKNLLINQELLHNDITLRKSDLYPRLSVGVGGSDNFTHFASERGKSDGSTLNFYGNFTLSYRLYNGGIVRRSIESSKIQSDIGELNIAELKLSLERDLNSAYDTYNNRIKIVGISHANVGIAKINLDLGSDKFKNGTINSFNYRDIQLKYILASLNELEAAYLLIQSHTELVRLTGGILSNTEQ